LNKPQHDEKNERHINGGKIHVDGEVEVRLPQSVIDKQDTERREEKDHETWKFRVEYITLAFVIIVAFLNYWQSNSAQTTATSALIDQRPYVVVKLPAALTPKFAPDVNMMAEITAANIGRTPAIRIHLFPALKYFPKIDPATLKLKADDYLIKAESDFLDKEFADLEASDKNERAILDPLHAEDDLAPGADLQTGDTITLQKAEFDDITSADPAAGALFVFGLVTYTGDSRATLPDRKTEFCWWTSGTDQTRWRRCRFHNVIR
jgi:hypothetical protein